jgi:gamma-D-glutamyl-L-lysine dipeptidyl-peptidase
MIDLEHHLAALLAAVREAHAPDPRLAVFDVDVHFGAHGVTLRGATSEADALRALEHRLAQLDLDARVSARVALVPDPAATQPAYALVRAPVAPMLSLPAIASVQVSQVVLGASLRVLRWQGRWLQCRSADGYLGWVHRGYVHATDGDGARRWESGDGGVPHVSLGARLADADDGVPTPLPWGARVCVHDRTVVLPDGRRGRAEGELVPLDARLERYPSAGEAVVGTAARWIGAPYLWGGVTPAGVDCSGLAQAVMRLHGVELPRDADLQSRAGAPVDPGAEFEWLRAGDLLFFAEAPGRITHVAISRTGSRIIHSSLGNGGVRLNDLAGELDFERELRELFVCARRVLPA